MAFDPRIHTTRRTSIVNALVEALKAIDGTGNYLVDVDRNVYPHLKFWDEVKVFPAIHVVAGTETREYQGDGYRDRFLNVSIWVYVDSPNSATELLDALIEDVETVIETQSRARMPYIDKTGNTQNIQLMGITQIVTDEGALNTEGLAVGEITVEVRY